MTNFTFGGLKFRTDKSVLNDEKYCEQLSDFEIRRLVIKEYKDILHVLFSKRIVVDILILLLIIISIFIFSYLLFFLSFIFLLFRFRLVNKYRGYYRTLRMCVSFIDKDIKKKYNMDMPDYF